MFHDHNYLDQDTLDAWRGLSKPGAFIFNAWHEAWGKHRWFPCAADDTQKDALAVMSGQPAEGIFRMNMAGFRQEAASARQAIAAVRRAGHFIAGLDRVASELRQCLTEKRVSRLRHLDRWERPYWRLQGSNPQQLPAGLPLDRRHLRRCPSR